MTYATPDYIIHNGQRVAPNDPRVLPTDRWVYTSFRPGQQMNPDAIVDTSGVLTTSTPTPSPIVDTMSLGGINRSWLSSILSGITGGAQQGAGEALTHIGTGLTGAPGPGSGAPSVPPGAPTNPVPTLPIGGPAGFGTTAHVGPFSFGYGFGYQPGQPTFPGLVPPDAGSGGPLVPSGALPSVTATPIQKACYRAPKGYSIVYPQGHDHPPVAVLTVVARALGLVHRRSRAAITARDMKGARHVQKFIQKMTVHRESKLHLKNRRAAR